MIVDIGMNDHVTATPIGKECNAWPRRHAKHLTRKGVCAGTYRASLFAQVGNPI